MSETICTAASDGTRIKVDRIVLSFAGLKLAGRYPEISGGHWAEFARTGVAVWAVGPLKLLEIGLLRWHTWSVGVRVSMTESSVCAGLNVCGAGGDRRTGWGVGGVEEAQTRCRGLFAVVAKVLRFLPLTCFAPPLLPGVRLEPYLWIAGPRDSGREGPLGCASSSLLFPFFFYLNVLLLCIFFFNLLLVFLNLLLVSS